MFDSMPENVQYLSRDEGEELSEDAKIRFLFKKIGHFGINSAVEAMKACIIASGTAITYTTIANHISTAISELPEYVAKNHNISDVPSTTSSVYNTDGSVKHWISSKLDGFL